MMDIASSGCVGGVGPDLSKYSLLVWKDGEVMTEDGKVRIASIEGGEDAADVAQKYGTTTKHAEQAVVFARWDARLPDLLRRYPLIVEHDDELWIRGHDVSVHEINEVFKAEHGPGIHDLADRFGISPLHAWHAVACLRNWNPDEPLLSLLKV